MSFFTVFIKSTKDEGTYFKNMLKVYVMLF